MVAREPQDALNIRREPIVYNKYITTDKKCITNQSLYEPKLITINDFVDCNGKFKSFQQFSTDNGNILKHYDYMCIIDSIPKEWRKMLKATRIDQQMCVTNEGICLILHNNIAKSIHAVASKEIYWHLINETLVLPTCIKSWNDRLELNLDQTNWKQIFLLPFQCTNDVKVRDLQIKILHRFYPCKSLISKWDNEAQDICNLCGKNNANILHTFYDCHKIVEFYMSLYMLLEKVISMYVKEIKNNIVLFGILPYTVGNHCINHCFLYSKYYLHIKHTTKKTVSLVDFKSYYRKVLDVEKELYDVGAELYDVGAELSEVAREFV